MPGLKLTINGKEVNAKSLKQGQLDIIHNSLKTNGESRDEEMGGVAYKVYRCVMITEGVLNGIYYPGYELERNLETWNGRTIPVYHPTGSQNEPKNFGDAIGFLFQARTEHNSGINRTQLIADLWIDEAKARELGLDYVTQRLANGETMEVSTGVYIDEVWMWDVLKDGEDEYASMAYNLRGDHLALLPDDVGASSVADGSGVRDNAGNRRARQAHLKEMKQDARKVPPNINTNTDNKEEGDMPGLNEKEAGFVRTLFNAFGGKSDDKAPEANANQPAPDATPKTNTEGATVPGSVENNSTPKLEDLIKENAELKAKINAAEEAEMAELRKNAIAKGMTEKVVANLSKATLEALLEALVAKEGAEDEGDMEDSKGDKEEGKDDKNKKNSAEPNSKVVDNAGKTPTEANAALGAGVHNRKFEGGLTQQDVDLNATAPQTNHFGGKKATPNKETK